MHLILFSTASQWKIIPSNLTTECLHIHLIYSFKMKRNIEFKNRTNNYDLYFIDSLKDDRLFLIVYWQN